MSKYVNRLAVRGLVGWHIQGDSYYSSGEKYATFSKGPYDEPPGDCMAIDMKEVYEQADNAISLVWRRPTLDLSIPDGNVRSLFEGCIGHEGTTAGHPWDGRLESLTGSDSVGLNVYIAVLLSQGGKIVK